MRKTNRKCKIDEQECDFWYGFMRPTDRYYWINTLTRHLSIKGYPTHIYYCGESERYSIDKD